VSLGENTVFVSIGLLLGFTFFVNSTRLPLETSKKTQHTWKIGTQGIMVMLGIIDIFGALGSSTEMSLRLVVDDVPAQGILS